MLATQIVQEVRHERTRMGGFAFSLLFPSQMMFLGLIQPIIVEVFDYLSVSDGVGIPWPPHMPLPENGFPCT